MCHMRGFQQNEVYTSSFIPENFAKEKTNQCFPFNKANKPMKSLNTIYSSNNGKSAQNRIKYIYLFHLSPHQSKLLSQAL